MKIDRDAPVGVFDSGIGGLTVAREIMRNLPSEKIVYFGDTARVPYGSKSRETIIGYSRQIIRFLKEQKVKAIVVACNTASAFALEAVQEEFDIPILGVIEAGAKVNPAYETALELGRLLKEQDMQSTGQGQSDFPYRFYVSDLAEKFKGFANSILPFDVEKTQKIDIEKY